MDIEEKSAFGKWLIERKKSLENDIAWNRRQIKELEKQKLSPEDQEWKDVLVDNLEDFENLLKAINLAIEYLGAKQ